MSFLRPLLFEVIDGEGCVTLDQLEERYRQARKVMDAGYRFAIRARPRKCYELTVRDGDDQAISLVFTGEQGVALHEAAERLISHAHGVLFDPLPW